MAAYNKFNQFVSDLLNGKHILQGGTPTHVLNVCLTNTAPVATNAILSDITQIANGNGYATNGVGTGNVSAAASGTETVTGTNVTWTCVTAAMATFRYVVLFNFTQAAPVKPLVAWWDYGSGLTLNPSDTFTVKFNNGASSGTIFTLT